MKVVIFCGGFGVRMGEETQRIPKPMIEIGGKPILWHIMRYYAMWGHDDFILCLGYKGEVVKQFFLSYNGALLNDFVLDHDAGGTKLELLSRDLDKWRITFVDTGLNATIGERLKAVAPFIGDDETFLATYGDGLTDAPLTPVIQAFHEAGRRRCSCRCGRSSTPTSSPPTPTERPRRWRSISRSDVRINGGFFVFEARDPRPDRARRRARRGDLRAADRGARADRVPVRRVLPGDGHDQGPPAPRDPARVGQAPWRRFPATSCRTPCARGRTC